MSLSIRNILIIAGISIVALFLVNKIEVIRKIVYSV